MAAPLVWLALLMFGAVATPAVSDAAGSASTAAAVVVADTGMCFLLDGDGTFINAGRSNAQRVEVSRQNNGIEGVCVATVAPAADGRARLWNHQNTARDCTLLLDGVVHATRDWQLTVTPDGQATLTCRLAER